MQHRYYVNSSTAPEWGEMSGEESASRRLQISFEGESGDFRFTVESDHGDAATLFRVAALICVRPWRLLQGSFTLSAKGEFRSHFSLRPDSEPIDQEQLTAQIKAAVADSERLLFSDLSVPDYLEQYGVKMSHNFDQPGGVVEVTEPTGEGVGIAIVRESPDQTALLRIAQAFYMMDVEIQAGSLHFDSDGALFCTIHLDVLDKRLHNSEYRKRFREELQQMLG